MKNTQTSNKDIKRFVSNIAEKNYSDASKSLQKVIENKLKQKIVAALDAKI